MRGTLDHGHARRKSHTNIYRRWQHIISRCNNPKDRDYARYGAKGIQICDRWRFGEQGQSGFVCFLADMGEPPSRAYSLDRIDNDKGYSPDNCRWATAREQANNRRATKMLTVDGVTKPLSYWCEELGIGPKTVLFRLKRGLNHKDALLLPIDQGRKLP